MTDALDWFLWLTGAWFWIVIMGFGVAMAGNALGLKWRRRRINEKWTAEHRAYRDHLRDQLRRARTPSR